VGDLVGRGPMIRAAALVIADEAREVGRPLRSESSRRTARKATPMQLAHVYVNFPGTTSEALSLYEKAFGTKTLMKMTFGEVPWMPNAPAHAKDKIMHAELPITEVVHLMASDFVEGVSPGQFVRGNDVHISVVAKDKAEADRVFEILCSGGGSARMPLANAPWGPYFGMCVDRFGVQWMVSLPNPV
jgi:PhnB protein